MPSEWLGMIDSIEQDAISDLSDPPLRANPPPPPARIFCCCGNLKRQGLSATIAQAMLRLPRYHIKLYHLEQQTKSSIQLSFQLPFQIPFNMKFALATAAAILLASQASAATVAELRTDFASHVKTHNKVYDSAEYERRFGQYRKNKQFVDAHNANT